MLNKMELVSHLHATLFELTEGESVRRTYCQWQDSAFKSFWLAV